MDFYKTIRKCFPVLAVLQIVAGCTASGANFYDTPFATQPVPADKARIIFYRDSDINFRAATIGIDGSGVGAVDHDGFIVAEVDPGEHKISAWVRGFFQEFVTGMSFEPGKPYYIRVSQRSERLMYSMVPLLGPLLVLIDTKGEFQLELMPESTALQQLRDLKLSE
jgi:hypothetical protein